jgi:Nif-specific regulatory protein
MSGSAVPQESIASLEVIGGPLHGQIFRVARDRVTIGREPSNDVAILDASISRHHFRIEREDGEFRVVDLGSSNGLQVNGKAVKEHPIRHGDRIQAGNCVLLFCSPTQGGKRPPEALPFSEDEPAGDATVVLRREDAVYLRDRDTLPPTRKTVQDLDVLLRFSHAVSSLRSLEALQKQLIQTLVEIAPAERVALLLNDDENEVTVVAGWDYRLGSAQPVKVSGTIVRRVLKDAVAVTSNDVANSDLQSSESLIMRRVCSVAAVPLMVFDRAIGVMYLDGAKSPAGFTEAQLQLLTAVGNIAALGIDNVRRFEWLEGENRRLRDELDVKHDMVGDSPAMRDVYQFIARVAGRDSTVLIFGESGTGKELVARALHRNSPRAGQPFVAINCAAITDTLLESELFGHEKGAFTGASAQKLGKLEVAHGGTVFLDEIGELAPQLQAKLLRVLQEREFERVGGTRPIKLDIRLIAATNRDLKAEARAGKFREDLYYRLNVVSLRMPALRDRREDIPLLASHFAVKAAAAVKRPVTGISPKARACLIQYDWPGNVRELENAIERAVVLGSSDIILPEDLPESVLEEASAEDQPVSALHDALLDAKRQIIVKSIDQANGNYTEAAKALGVHPNHFFRLIKTLNLKPKRQKG